MRNNALGNILLGVQAVIALLSVFWCAQYIIQSRRIHETQYIVSRNGMLVSLARDAVEYSKTHPDIGPVLEASGVKQVQISPPQPAAAKPGTK